MKAGMKAKRIIRRGVDAAMYLLYLLLMGQYALRGAAHEWLGMAIGLLFLAHNALNLSWYRALGRGGRSAARTLQSIVNLPLALVMLLCMISGMLVSRHIFSIGGRLIELGRRVHLCATAWGFVLMSLHLGMHGSLLTRSIRRAGRRRALSSLAAALCVCGMILLVKRRFREELFLQIDYQKEYDYSLPLAAHCAGSAALSAVFAAAGHWARRMLIGIKRK